LYALALVAIPIIIHLFNFRKFKTVYFSNLRFLKSVKEKTKSQSQLKHLLILLSRVLAISSIVFAFAQPYLPESNTNKKVNKQAASIYIDNSFSMEAENQSGRLLQTAQKQALAIAQAYSNSDELYFLDNQFKAIHQRSLNQEQFYEAVNSLESFANTPTLNQIFKRQKNTLQNSLSQQKDIYIISDFQQQISDIEWQISDSLYSIRLLPLEGYQKGNVFIDSCWLHNPNPQIKTNIKLYVRLKSLKTEPTEVNLSLSIDQEQKALANALINQQEIIELNFSLEEPSWHNGILSIQDYPISFDDTYYFSFEIKPQIKVQHIYQNQAHPSIKKLFDQDDYFQYSTQNVLQLNHNSIAQQQLLILDGLEQLTSGLQQSIRSGLQKGMSVLIFPSLEMDIEDYKRFCNSLGIGYYSQLNNQPIKIKDLDYNHPLFEGVFETFEKTLNFPQVKAYFDLSQNNRTRATSLLNFENNKSFFSVFPHDKGNLYLSSVGLDPSFGNFSQHALFVPILYNIASFSGGQQRLAYTIGHHSIPFQKAGYNQPYNLSQGNFECIPDVRANGLYVGQHLMRSGHYLLRDKEQKEMAYLSFNYDRKESDLKTISREDLEQSIKDYPNVMLIDESIDSLSTYIQQLNKGTALWQYFILLSLIFLILETLLIRFL
jgi:hypothetical protein